GPRRAAGALDSPRLRKPLRLGGEIRLTQLRDAGPRGTRSTSLDWPRSLGCWRSGNGLTALWARFAVSLEWWPVVSVLAKAWQSYQPCHDSLLKQTPGLTCYFEPFPEPFESCRAARRFMFWL